MEEIARYDLQIYRGKTYRKDGRIRIDGEPLDLTACMIEAQIRPEENSPKLIAEFEIDRADQEDGYFSMNLDSETTAAIPNGIYYWDLKVIDPDGDVNYYVHGRTVIGGRVTE